MDRCGEAPLGCLPKRIGWRYALVTREAGPAKRLHVLGTREVRTRDNPEFFPCDVHGDTWHHFKRLLVTWFGRASDFRHHRQFAGDAGCVSSHSACRR